MNDQQKKEYMLLALSEAETAFRENEVPVGAVLVRDGEILAHDHNRCMQRGDYTAHAEMLCIQAVSPKFHGRLDGCELVVTLEPCAMRTGAAVNAKISKIIFGAFDPHSGCCGSVFNLADHCFLFSIETEGGLMQQECASLLSRFFRIRREENRLSRNISKSQAD